MAVLQATQRTEVGSKRVRRVRKSGLIPAIIYGHGEAPQNISLPARELVKALQHGEHRLELNIEGQTQNVLVKEVQYDALQQDVLHVDLARVNLDERVKVTVPVILRGVAAGATEGGVLTQVSADVEIECTVRNIPDEIRVSIASMKIGDVLHLRDVPLPEGGKLVSDGETILATVSVVAEEEAAPVEAGAATPEVIGAKTEEEGEAPKK